METTKKTYEQMTETERQRVADAVWGRERPRCQSGLVDDLIKNETDGFGIDDMENLYPDPSDWGIEQCREFIRERQSDMPDPNPWNMDRAELAETLTDAGIQVYDHEDTDTLLAAVIANIDDETVDGIDDWRKEVSDIAEMAEPYEWWEVGSWLAERLAERGEVVIRNGYGDWWGRCCTGQSVTLDYVIQRLGAEYCAWAIEKD